MRKTWKDLKVGQKYIKIGCDFYSKYNGLTVFVNKTYTIYSIYSSEKCLLTSDNPTFKFVFGNIDWFNDNFEPAKEEEIIL